LTRRKTTADADIGDLERDGLLQAREPSPDAEARLIAADDTERLRRALADLPLALRETLTLRAIHGLSYRDISTATEAPIGTVMSRLARARSALAALLEEKK
jgi:RNA polymerase sigma-70 factor (ECF subfamily)